MSAIHSPEVPSRHPPCVARHRDHYDNTTAAACCRLPARRRPRVCSLLSPVGLTSLMTLRWYRDTRRVSCRRSLPGEYPLMLAHAGAAAHCRMPDRGRFYATTDAWCGLGGNKHYRLRNTGSNGVRQGGGCTRQRGRNSEIRRGLAMHGDHGVCKGGCGDRQVWGGYPGHVSRCENSAGVLLGARVSLWRAVGTRDTHAVQESGCRAKASVWAICRSTLRREGAREGEIYHHFYSSTPV